MPDAAYLIINADDYAFYHCISKGILDCIQHGVVTATGVFANSPHLEQHARWLMAEEHVDVGVHLNLTDRYPLTRCLSDALAANRGGFYGKFPTAGMILAKRIKVEWVRDEWRAQIERCLAAGLSLKFLNSHEHLHMLPPLYPVALALAREYGIEHVRMAAPEWPRIWSPQALLRDALMGVLACANRLGSSPPAPRLLGMGASGRLSSRYLAAVLLKLRPGEVYELMCHPGFFDADEIEDRRVRAYHAWEQERQALSEPEFRARLAACNVILIGYRQLRMEQGILRLRSGEASQ